MRQRCIDVQYEWIDVGTKLGNDERNAISPVMKWTSLDSLSSFVTAIEHLRFRARLSALANCGRSSSASAPLPVSTCGISANITDITAKGKGRAAELEPGLAELADMCLGRAMSAQRRVVKGPDRW